MSNSTPQTSPQAKGFILDASLPTQQPAVVVERKRKDTAQFILPPSPADSMLDTNPNSPTSTTFGPEGNRLMRDIDRGAPGDGAIFSERKTAEQRQLAKRKSQHYNEAFANRESNSSARERVLRESVVVADVRTNVIVDDEYTFITDLSYNLSSRYQRPESSILVTVTHSACLLFGGSFDPAYTMTITALPSQVQAVTNKRNAVLLQRTMEEALGVPAERGLIRFVAIAEENLATNGKTAAGEIEELEKASGEESSVPAARRRSSVAVTKGNKRKGSRQLKQTKSSQLLTHDEQPTVSEKEDETPPVPQIPDMPTQPSSLDRKAEKVQKVGKRKSFIAAVFRR